MIDSLLHKTFGPVCYNQLKGHLHEMIDVGSKQQFEETLAAAKDMLHSMPVKNGEAETNLNDFAANQTRMPHTVFVK